MRFPARPRGHRNYISTEADTPSEPEPGPSDPPANGERADHHSSVPGEEVEGGAGTDPAQEPKPPEEPHPDEPRGEGEMPPDSAMDGGAAEERGDE